MGIAKRIKEIDPVVRLSLLQEYMVKFIDNYPYKHSFESFIFLYHQRIIPGTAEYYKQIATHCFYCPAKLVKGNTSGDNLRRATIDHYFPKSKGRSNKYVICCAVCNTGKDNRDPSKVASMLLTGSLKGKTIWGYSGKVLQQIAKQFQIIENDLLYNTGPKVYYVRK